MADIALYAHSVYRVGDTMNSTQFTFTQGSRSQKARILPFFTKFKVNLLTAIVLGGTLLGIGLLFAGSKAGYILFALATASYSLLLWFKWDLSELDSAMPFQQSSTRLEEILQSDIVNTVGRATTAIEIWQAISGHWQAAFFSQRFMVTQESITRGLGAAPIDLQAVYSMAYDIAIHSEHDQITAGCLTAALILCCPALASELTNLRIDRVSIERGLHWQHQILERYFTPKKRELFGGIARDWSSGYTPILDQYGENISKAIESGYTMFSGAARTDVIDQMIQIIGRPGRNGVALVAPLGSGKSSLVYALAEKMLKGEEGTGTLAYMEIVKLDANLITSRVGQNLSIDQIMEQIFYDAVHAHNVILFLDEAQLFMDSAAGSVDVSHIIMQVLEQTKMPIILALNPVDWHTYSTTKSALMTQLTKIDLVELDEEQVIRILEDFSLPLEAQAKAIVAYPALKEVYDLSNRYIAEKAFPAKAIDLLQDSMNYAENGLVTSNSVKMAIEKTTGAKVTEVTQAERSELLNLEDNIHRRMINQVHAVKTVAEALRRSRAGVRDVGRPVGSFLFLGPTGVGKTELARSLADTYFGSEANMIRLDMSEYQLAEDVTRILEATSDGAVGSSFLREVATKPSSIVLLDEIEKAHPSILNLLLQMLDEGTLTDTSGKVVSFREAIIIVTSNAGADAIRQRIESGQELEAFAVEFINQLINTNVFKPELLNRFDDTALFRPLKLEELMQVVQIMVTNLNTTLAKQSVSVELSQDALEFIIRVGYDPRLGARPMRRALQHYVENIISQKILGGETQPGSVVKLRAADFGQVDPPVATQQVQP